MSQLPFDSPAPLDLSARYVIDSCAATGADIERQRNSVLAHLRRKSRSLRTCNTGLVDLMAASVRGVAGEANVALLLYLQIISGWPDINLASDMVRGLHIVGDVPCPPIFRSAFGNPEALCPEDLLKESDNFIDELEASMRPATNASLDDALWEACAKDMKRFGAGPFARSHMDAQFGRGRWRPLASILAVAVVPRQTPRH